MFLAHSLFVIFVFSLQIFPGLIEKAIFDTTDRRDAGEVCRAPIKPACGG